MSDAAFPPRARLAVEHLSRRVDRIARRKISIPLLLFDDLGATDPILNIPASLLLGRGQGGGAGPVQYISIGANLTLTGTVLSATPGGGPGVTSVDASVPAEMQLAAGLPITGSGTIAISWNSASGRKFIASPADGTSGAYAGRAIVLADIPDLSSLYQPLDADLTQIAALATTGFPARTAADTWALRSLAAGSTKLSLANPAGVAGNPTYDVVEANLNLGAMGGTVPVNHGGTNATTASDARTNLGLVIGTNVQAWNADLDAIAALVTTSFGLDFLTLTDAADGRAYLGLGTLATQSGTFSGTSSGTNTGDQTNITGNAGTATALQTARNINGVSFNGTADITISAAPGGSAGGVLSGTYPNPDFANIASLTFLANSTGGAAAPAATAITADAFTMLAAFATQSAISDPTGGSVVDVEARTAIASILAERRTNKGIAT